MATLLSKNSDGGLTPVRLQQLARGEGFRRFENGHQGVVRQRSFYRLSEKLGPDGVADAIRRYQAGESATSLAADLGVATSALIRLMRERNVVVRKGVVTPELAATLALEYGAGATMADLEAKHALSHGAVFRALQAQDVVKRAPHRRLSGDRG